jgi:hypothetical protein
MPALLFVLPISVIQYLMFESSATGVLFGIALLWVTYRMYPLFELVTDDDDQCEGEGCDDPPKQ